MHIYIYIRCVFIVCIQFVCFLAFLHDTYTCGAHPFSASVARGAAPYGYAIDLIQLFVLSDISGVRTRAAACLATRRQRHEDLPLGDRFVLVGGWNDTTYIANAVYPVFVF